MTMTTDRPDHRGFGDDGDDCANVDSSVRRWWQRRAYTREENTDTAMMIGALALICFWAPGLAIVLGLIALGWAWWADHSPELHGAPATRGDAVLAYISGAAGVIAGTGFLALVLPNW